MKKFERKHYKPVKTETGVKHVYDHSDFYGVGMEDGKIVFCLNDKVSKPILVQYNGSYSWKPLKSRIESTYTAAEFLKEIVDPLWNCYLYRFCRFYVLGIKD